MSKPAWGNLRNAGSKCRICAGSGLIFRNSSTVGGLFGLDLRLTLGLFRDIIGLPFSYVFLECVQNARCACHRATGGLRFSIGHDAPPIADSSTRSRAFALTLPNR